MSHTYKFDYISNSPKHYPLWSIELDDNPDDFHGNCVLTAIERYICEVYDFGADDTLEEKCVKALRHGYFRVEEEDEETTLITVDTMFDVM